MPLMLLHKPGSELSELRLDNGKFKERQLVLAHYNQRPPARALVLHPFPEQHFTHSSFTMALPIVSKPDYSPNKYVLGFNHLNSNIVLTAYAFAHPERVKALDEYELERAKEASIFSETLANDDQYVRQLHFGIEDLLESVRREKFPGSKRWNQAQVAAVATNVMSAAADGHLAELEGLLHDPSHGGYAQNHMTLIESSRDAIKSIPPAYYDLQLPGKKRLRVAVFDSGTTNLHPLAGYDAAKDADIVVRKMGRSWSFGVHPDRGKDVSLPPAFYKALRDFEKAKWKERNLNITPLLNDLPGGRSNAGGTSRGLKSFLTTEKLLELLAEHAEVRPKRKAAG